MAFTQIIRPNARDLGGLMVQRAIPQPELRAVGPFVFWDQFGPAEYPPGEGMDVRPHPHIGLETITYLFDGEIMHRDNTGAVRAIRPGDVNWMTAGRGIVHSERTGDETRAAGHLLHGIQSWIALPKALEKTAPRFVHHPADSLPKIERDGVTATVIAGEAFDAKSPVEAVAPIIYAALEFSPGGKIACPANAEERGLYVVDGEIEAAGQTLRQGDLAVLASDAAPMLSSAEGARVMLLGGAKLDAPRRVFWNYVASDPADIEEAKRDWEEAAANGFASGRFTLPEGETEYIPAPKS